MLREGLMIENLKNLEQTAPGLEPIILVGPAVACVLLGLFLWLGGSAFRRPLAALAGLLAGAACGFVVIGRNTISLIIAAAAGCIIATIIERAYTALTPTGFFFSRLIPALCSTALGTLLIFAGMILLLLYKGSAPITHINDRQSFYATVCIAMIAFGTITQLLPCPPVRQKPTAKKRPHHPDQELDK